MTLEFIYLTRHGFRSNWVVDHKTGKYSTSIPSPTGIASDPALAGKSNSQEYHSLLERSSEQFTLMTSCPESRLLIRQCLSSHTTFYSGPDSRFRDLGHGVDQSHQLAAHLSTLDPPIQRIYSSPFYRCIQTILPTVKALSITTDDPETKKIRAENGLGEWYGLARFDHPSPADLSLLKQLFPCLDEEYKTVIRPSVNGESIYDLHNRVAYTLHRIIEQADKEGVKAIALCTHGATLIAIGRALVGRMPEDISEQDFNPFTCGLTTFVRMTKGSMELDVKQWEGPETEIPEIKWREGRGVGGGWVMTVDGDCSFLADGEERGWRFSGDESFITPKDNEAAKGLDAGELGVVVGSRPTSAFLSKKTPDAPGTLLSPLSPSKL